MPRVSVVIPSYNHEKYVAEAIQSVLDQTFQDFEIIVTDDGSTDRTAEVIRSFSDSRLRLLVLPENRGAAFAANNCLQHARGEYVAMLSSDDAFLPHKLERQVGFLDEHRERAAVFSRARIVDERGDVLTRPYHYYCTIFHEPNRSRQEWLHFFFFRGNCLCHPSMLIRRSCYEQVGGYDPRLAQLPDLDFWVRLCLRHEIHVLPEELIRFRVRAGGGNISTPTPEAIARHEWEHFTILRHYLGVRSVEDFGRIFPEADGVGALDDEALVPYFLAKIALGTGKQPYALFGLHTLFELLGDPDAAELVRRRMSFSYTDLIALTGSRETTGLPAAAGALAMRLVDALFPESSWRRHVLRRMKRARDRAAERRGRAHASVEETTESVRHRPEPPGKES